MPENQTIPLAELKSLLVALFKTEEGIVTKLKARLYEEFDNWNYQENPADLARRNKCTDWMCDTLARRMKQDRRITPLLSHQDWAEFAIPMVIEEFEQKKGYELDPNEQKMIEKLVSRMFEEVSEMIDSIVLQGKTPYDEYWRWVTTTLELATEQCIPPTKLLTLENGLDEISRRMFTKEQFLAYSHRRVKKFTDIDSFKKAFIQPMLEALSLQLDDDELRETVQEIEADIMPELINGMEKIKVVLNTFFDEEAERIYGIA